MRISPLILVLGTDPRTQSGGVSFSVPGHMRAYQIAGADVSYIVTHRSGSFVGKFLPFLASIRLLLISIFSARRNGRLIIVVCHVGGGITSMVRKYFLGCLSRFMGAKVVFQLHGFEVNSYLSSSKSRRFFSYFIAPADIVCVLTPWWRSYLQAAGIVKPIFVIPNPLPVSWEDVALKSRTYCENDTPVTILTLSRLEAGKGVNDVIKAMSLLPNVFRLVIAGTGSDEASLRDLVDSLELNERVRFCGWVSGENKQELFDQSDIFALPTRYDSFGMGFLEALANGLPVVAYDWGPVSDIILDKKCGLLAKEYSPPALAECIQRLKSYKIRKTYGVYGKRWVLKSFSAMNVATEVSKVMEALEDENL